MTPQRLAAAAFTAGVAVGCAVAWGLCRRALRQPEQPPQRVALRDGKRRVCVGCSGSVAAVKLGEIVRRLVEDHGCFVDVVLTRSGAFFQSVGYNGTQGWAELDRLRALRAHDGVPRVEVWQDDDEWVGYSSVSRSRVLHIDLVKRNFVLLVAPACANTLACANLGLANNLLTSLVLAWHWNLQPDVSAVVPRPIIFAPAMNTYMHDDARVASMMAALRQAGAHVVPTVSKQLACGDVGRGALADVDAIVDCAIEQLKHSEKSPLESVLSA